jgi:hypothetical protein
MPFKTRLTTRLNGVKRVKRAFERVFMVRKTPQTRKTASCVS